MNILQLQLRQNDFQSDFLFSLETKSNKNDFSLEIQKQTRVFPYEAGPESLS